MYRDIVKGNKICYKFNDEQHVQTHVRKVLLAQSKIDNSVPSSMDLNIPYHSKKNQILEEKFTEIERENRILLEKITNIMHKSLIDNIRSRSQGIQKKTLNSEIRKKQLVKITVENERILNRIKNKRSLYETKKILRETQKHDQIIQRISEFPLNKKGNRSIDGSRMLKQKSGENKLVNLSFNGHEEQSKKKILFKGILNQNQTNYQVEIYFSSGVFKISADEPNQPITKILEMSHKDGFQVILSQFNRNESAQNNFSILSSMIEFIQKVQNSSRKLFNNNDIEHFLKRSTGN